MINGLQVEFNEPELNQHLNARATYHRERAAFYRTQAGALEAGMQANPQASNDPITSLRRSQTEHESKASFFKVLADHLVKNEIYRLSENDLARIEIYSRFF